LEGVVVINSMAQLLRWTLHHFGLHTMLMLTLLTVIVISMVVGIVGAVGGLEASLMVIVALVGLLVGWWLAATSLSGWKSGILIFVLGWAGLFLRVGRLGDEILSLLQASFGLARDVLPWLLVFAVLQRPPQSFFVDWLPISSALADLWGGVTTLAIRVVVWLQALVLGESAVDPVAATLVWGMVLWLVTSWAAWTLRRRARPLLAIAPGGVLLIAALSYQRTDSTVIPVLLGAVLLLLALVAYATRLRRWQAAGIDFPDLGNDTVLAVIVVTLVLVFSAAVSPAITIQNLTNFMGRLAPGQAGESGVGSPAPVVVAPDSMEKSSFEDLRVGGLPRRHLLGSGPELSEKPVMSISTGELPAGPEEIFGAQAPRYYWRGITYDVYTGRGWVTREAETVDYLAEDSLALPRFEAQREVRQNVRIVGEVAGLLHATGTLDSVDQDYSVAWRSEGDIFGATLESTRYQAVSLVSIATEEELRSAGSDYPDWIQDRYLALPETVPDRVLGLARDLTATEATPYDRAVAIESYLRTYPYNLDVSLPPAGTVDVVDYFLFELKEGYCDYYATSMVVLARAAGLPARLVIGYAPGYYDARGAVYVVTEAEAHAWVEVYFPEYGWIEFEPTGGRLPIRRSDDEERAPLDLPDLDQTSESASATWGRIGRYAWLVWLLPFVLPVLIVRAWLSIDERRLRKLEPPAAVARLYQRVRRYGRELAMPMRAGDTPYEFARSFAGWATALAREKPWGEIIAGAISEVRRLVDLYVEANYTPRPMRTIDFWYALQVWRKLWWRLWLGRLFQWRRRLSSRHGRGRRGF
jgi:transglutaminase-like putative cysteine protease